MPEEVKEWITVKGKHIPLDDEGEPMTKTGKKTLGKKNGGKADKTAAKGEADGKRLQHIRYTKRYSQYLEENGSDHKKAAERFFKEQLQGKSLMCDIDGARQEVHFTGGSWKEIKRGIGQNPLKAEIIPHIQEILKSGESVRREVHKERKDDATAFYAFRKAIRTSEGAKEAIVDVIEREYSQYRYSVYSLTGEGIKGYRERQEFANKKKSPISDRGMSHGPIGDENDSVVKDIIQDAAPDSKGETVLEVFNIRFQEEGTDDMPNMPRDRPRSDRIAFDAKSTQRRKDNNGYLHVAASNITKEQVAPYYGSEIPGCRELGLTPSKLYYMYRPADELAKAAESFNGMPILFEHHATNAANPAKEYVIGSLGTDAEFSAPYLVNSLIITDGEAIEAIERGEYKELSAAYVYTPVMQGGIFGGEHYDGRMTDIKANHVALVKEGRAGPDVAVADSMPKSIDRAKARKQRRNYAEMDVKTRLKLAMDAIPDIESAEVNAANYQKAVNAVEAQREGLDPREIGLEVDKSASVADIVATLFPGLGEEARAAITASLESLKAAPATDTEEKTATDDDGEDKSFAEGVKYGEELIRNPEERKKIDREHESEGMKKAMDECGIDAEDPATSKAFAEGVKYGEKLMRNNAEREKLDREHEAEGMKKAMEDQKAAMDAQIKSVREKALSDTREHFKALYRAAQECRPILGALVDPMTFDSADDIYRKALSAAGVDTKDVHPSAFPAMLKMARTNMTREQAGPAPIAMDAAPESGEHFKGALEGLARIMTA